MSLQGGDVSPRRRKGRAASGMAAALASLLALSPFTACKVREPAPLRVGVPPWPSFELLHLAEEKGYFAAEGIAVRLVEYASLVDVVRAMELGQVDVMAVTSMEMLMVRHTGKSNPVAFLATDFSNGADVLLAKPGIRDAADLRGRRIGAETGAFGLFFVHRALEKAGLAPGDVTLVPIDLGSMEKALKDGIIDAAACYPPFSTPIERLGLARPVFSSREIPGEIPGLLVMDSAGIAGRRADVEGLVRAWDRTLAAFRTDPEKYIAPMAARLDMSSGEFRASLATMEILPSDRTPALFAPDGTLSRALVLQERILRRFGKVSRHSRVEGSLAAPGAPDAVP